jgi:hypothetical protein
MGTSASSCDFQSCNSNFNFTFEHLREVDKKEQRRREGGATKSQEGEVYSARARGKAGLFPQLFPMPDAGSFVEEAVTELVGEHQNLTAMMRFVREHVSEHGPSGGPCARPTAAREF